MINLNNELKNVKSVGITGHIRPDGDCVGSTMALFLYIKKNMPDVDAHVYIETPPETFGCIKDIDAIENAEECDRVFDVFICVDSVKERTGAAEKLYDKAVKTINIDHHITNEGCGDVNYIVPEASSACELVFDVLDYSMIDVEIAKALYIGMIHDTGVFQYSNVSPKTFETAAKLILFGFDFPRLIDETFYEKTELQARILGYVLSNCMVITSGKIAVGKLTYEDMLRFGATSADMDGIVNQLRNIKGVQVAIFMYGQNEKSYKVSLRSSTDDIDVSKVCAFYGGGGHKRAAGVTLEGSFEEVVCKLTAEIDKQYV